MKQVTITVRARLVPNKCEFCHRSYSSRSIIEKALIHDPTGDYLGLPFTPMYGHLRCVHKFYSRRKET